jgi:hypothetical protein
MNLYQVKAALLAAEDGMYFVDPNYLLLSGTSIFPLILN